MGGAGGEAPSSPTPGGQAPLFMMPLSPYSGLNGLSLPSGSPLMTFFPSQFPFSKSPFSLLSPNNKERATPEAVKERLFSPKPPVKPSNLPPTVEPPAGSRPGSAAQARAPPQHAHAHAHAQAQAQAQAQAPARSGAKTCNCKNSKCLKLYCECFGSGQYCAPTCNCLNCQNNENHEEVRKKAVRSTLERNPRAFRPKVEGGSTEDDGKHIKGCKCTRSKCLKRYCECFQAGVQCSDACKCLDCMNKGDSAERQAIIKASGKTKQSENLDVVVTKKAKAASGRSDKVYGKLDMAAALSPHMMSSFGRALLETGGIATSAQGLSYAAMALPPHEREKAVLIEFSNMLQNVVDVSTGAAPAIPWQTPPHFAPAAFDPRPPLPPTPKEYPSTPPKSSAVRRL